MSNDLNPVIVTWVDSLILNDGGWMNVADVNEELGPGFQMHESVGYLIRESDHAIALASSRNAAEDSSANHSTRVCGVVVIPKPAIIDGPTPLKSNQ